MPVGRRPPWVKISQRGGSPAPETRLASMATTTHWLPNFSAATRTNWRSATAAELIEALSAPASSRLRMSSVVRTPPPTVSGMKQTSAVRRTTSSRMPRSSWLAVMSRKQSSSAPGLVVGDGALDRIAGVAQVDEIDALDDAAVLDVEAGDDAGFEGHRDAPSAGPHRCARKQRQRLARIEPAVVERAAGDRAGELRAVGLGQAPHVLDRGEAARRR